MWKQCDNVEEAICCDEPTENYHLIEFYREIQLIV